MLCYFIFKIKTSRDFFLIVYFRSYLKNRNNNTHCNIKFLRIRKLGGFTWLTFSDFIDISTLIRNINAIKDLMSFFKIQRAFGILQFKHTVLRYFFKHYIL